MFRLQFFFPQHSEDLQLSSSILDTIRIRNLLFNYYYFTDNLFFSLIVLRLSYPCICSMWELRCGFIFMYLSVDLMMMLLILDSILIFTPRNISDMCLNIVYLPWLLYSVWNNLFSYMLEPVSSMTINSCFTMFISLHLWISLFVNFLILSFRLLSFLLYRVENFCCILEFSFSTSIFSSPKIIYFSIYIYSFLLISFYFSFDFYRYYF